MTAKDLVFWIFAAVTCFSAIAVVVSQSVVRMAFWLIVSLGSTAGLFFLLNADFVGTAQLLVYVGGTLVLLIFGVMLTASGPFMTMKTSIGEATLAGGVAFLLLTLLFTSAYSVDWSRVVENTAGHSALRASQAPRGGFNQPEEGSTTRPLGFAFLGVRPDKDLNLKGGAKSETSQLSTGYLLPFEIASVHLLVVLIGAAYLARAKRRISNPSGSGSA